MYLKIMKGMNTRALVNGKRFPGQVEARGIEPCHPGEVSVQVRRDHPQLEPWGTADWWCSLSQLGEAQYPPKGGFRVRWILPWPISP